MKTIRNIAFLVVVGLLVFSPTARVIAFDGLPYSGCNTWYNPFGGGYVGWNSDCESVCPTPADMSCEGFCDHGREDCEWYCGGSYAGFSCNNLASYMECGCNYN
jgi:hypothetical protein